MQCAVLAMALSLSTIGQCPGSVQVGWQRPAVYSTGYSGSYAGGYYAGTGYSTPYVARNMGLFNGGGPLRGLSRLANVPRSLFGGRFRAYSGGMASYAPTTAGYATPVTGYTTQMYTMPTASYASPSYPMPMTTYSSPTYGAPVTSTPIYESTMPIGSGTPGTLTTGTPGATTYSSAYGRPAVIPSNVAPGQSGNQLGNTNSGLNNVITGAERMVSPNAPGAAPAPSTSAPPPVPTPTP
jgi:hypothetical protein